MRCSPGDRIAIAARPHRGGTGRRRQDAPDGRPAARGVGTAGLVRAARSRRRARFLAHRGAELSRRPAQAASRAGGPRARNCSPALPRCVQPEQAAQRQAVQRDLSRRRRAHSRPRYPHPPGAAARSLGPDAALSAHHPRLRHAPGAQRRRLGRSDELAAGGRGGGQPAGTGARRPRCRRRAVLADEPDRADPTGDRPDRPDRHRGASRAGWRRPRYRGAAQGPGHRR